MGPEEIVNKMYNNDAFSKWLGIELLSIAKGSCVLRMEVRDEMTNGFGIAHGGITFSLADSALAFASNSHGRHAVSIQCDIDHVKPVRAGDVITATAEESSLSNRICVYHIEVKNANGAKVALFKGVVYRKSAEWAIDN